MELDEYRYLWDGSEEGWGLFQLKAKPPMYSIINLSTRRALIIEADDLYREVIARMLAEGVRVRMAMPWVEK